MTVEPRHRRLLGISEAAEYANVHPSTLTRRIADGQLPAYRVGPARDERGMQRRRRKSTPRHAKKFLLAGSLRERWDSNPRPPA